MVNATKEQKENWERQRDEGQLYQNQPVQVKRKKEEQAKTRKKQRRGKKARTLKLPVDCEEETRPFNTTKAGDETKEITKKNQADEKEVGKEHHPEIAHIPEKEEAVWNSEKKAPTRTLER